MLSSHSYSLSPSLSFWLPIHLSFVCVCVCVPPYCENATTHNMQSNKKNDSVQTIFQAFPWGNLFMANFILSLSYCVCHYAVALASCVSFSPAISFWRCHGSFCHFLSCCCVLRPLAQVHHRVYSICMYSTEVTETQLHVLRAVSCLLSIFHTFKWNQFDRIKMKFTIQAYRVHTNTGRKWSTFFLLPSLFIPFQSFQCLACICRCWTCFILILTLWRFVRFATRCTNARRELFEFKQTPFYLWISEPSMIARLNKFQLLIYGCVWRRQQRRQWQRWRQAAGSRRCYSVDNKSPQFSTSLAL